MDDVLDIVTTPEEVKGASVTLNQKVMRGEDLLVEAHVQVAFVSGGRARPIPKPLRIAMKADQESGGGRLTARAIIRCMIEQHFRIFDTAIGTCGIVWSARGVAGVQASRRELKRATRARVLRRFAGAQEAPPPARCAARN